jgi:hypothetical protein
MRLEVDALLEQSTNVGQRDRRVIMKGSTINAFTDEEDNVGVAGIS